MDRYRVTVDFHLPGAPEQVTEQLGFAVLDALMELDDVADADLVGSLTLGDIKIEFVIEAQSYAQAHVKTATLIRDSLPGTLDDANAEPTDLIEETSTTIREIVAV